MAVRPNVNVTSTTPPASAILTQVVQVTRTDTVAFDAFVLPKNAVIVGAYVMGNATSDSNTSASISVGSNPGTTNEFVAAFDVKASTGKGYNAAAGFGGTSMGSQVTSNTLIKAKYTESGTATTGGPWLVKCEYYTPQSGSTF
jgi:hypothetical protein